MDKDVIKAQLFSIFDVPPNEQELVINSTSEPGKLSIVLLRVSDPRPTAGLAHVEGAAAAFFPGGRLSTFPAAQAKHVQAMFGRLQGASKSVAVCEFFIGISRNGRHMRLYQDSATVEAALKTIPVIQLYEKAQQQRNHKSQANDAQFRDLLLRELVNWFKHRFFRWVNSVACRFVWAQVVVRWPVGCRHRLL